LEYSTPVFSSLQRRDFWLGGGLLFVPGEEEKQKEKINKLDADDVNFTFTAS